MSTIKAGQILLYCHVKNIIKRPGTSFLFPALNQKHAKNVCHTALYYLTTLHFDSTHNSKELSISVTSIM